MSEISRLRARSAVLTDAVTTDLLHWQPLRLYLTLLKICLIVYRRAADALRRHRRSGSSRTRSALPVKQPHLSETIRLTPPAPTPPQRVLIVDDNPDAALTMAMTLKLLGNDVRTAHDGVSAISVAAEYQPHIIFMDVGMPKLNGYEATRRIREQPWGSKIVIIALTGWGQEADRRDSKEAGCNGHLLKPVELTDIQRVLAGNVPSLGGQQPG